MKTETEPTTTNNKTLLQHIVEVDAQGNPMDKCLCGHLWDRVFIQPGGDICQKCLDILKERQSGL